jgi:hypothetical protein
LYGDVHTLLIDANENGKQLAWIEWRDLAPEGLSS